MKSADRSQNPLSDRFSFALRETLDLGFALCFVDTYGGTIDITGIFTFTTTLGVRLDVPRIRLIASFDTRFCAISLHDEMLFDTPFILRGTWPLISETSGRKNL